MARSRAQKSTPKKAKPSSKNNTKAKKKVVSNPGFKTPSDVCKAIFQFMCGEYEFGMNEWTREELAHAVGYGNPRTEKFAHGLKILLQTEGLVEAGSKKGTLALSSKGISNMPVKSQPKTLQDIHVRFQQQLEKKVAAGANKIKPLWAILEDRKPHTVDSIARKLGYGNPRSFQNTKMLPLMVTMGLVTRTGKSIQMTDKAFPSNLCQESIAML